MSHNATHPLLATAALDSTGFKLTWSGKQAVILFSVLLMSGNMK